MYNILGFRLQNSTQQVIRLSKIRIRGYGELRLKSINKDFVETTAIYLYDPYNFAALIFPTPKITISKLNLLNNQSPLLCVGLINNQITLKNTTSCKLQFTGIKVRDTTDTIKIQIPSDVVVYPKTVINLNYEQNQNNNNDDYSENKLDIRLFDSYGHWLKIIRSDSSIITSTSRTQDPEDWIVGSRVEIWSVTRQSWNNGVIKHITDDEEGEWLTVEYSINFLTTTKQVKRYDTEVIRSRKTQKRGYVYMCYI